MAEPAGAPGQSLVHWCSPVWNIGPEDTPTMLTEAERHQAKQTFEIVTQRRMPWQLSQTRDGHVAIRLAGAHGKPLAVMAEVPSYAQAMNALVSVLSDAPVELTNEQTGDLVLMLWSFVGIMSTSRGVK